MGHFRAFLLRHRTLALLLVFAALCMKIVVPNGFMVGQNAKALTVQICADAFASGPVKQLVIPMKDGGSGSGSKQAKSECPFASLSMASTAGADPALLALALAFILALGFAPSPIPQPKRIFYLRPPLRGPPALV